MTKDLLLVDDNDNVIGYEDKYTVHTKELLHRAFSLFIYDKSSDSFLLQKRAKGKYHSGGLWTNSCCSHPRKGEKIKDTVVRRTDEELGINIDPEIVHEIGKFRYYKKYPLCAENEIDHVFLAEISKSEITIQPDESEVEEIKWMSTNNVMKMLGEKPMVFTAWFEQAFRIVLNNI